METRSTCAPDAELPLFPPFAAAPFVFALRSMSEEGDEGCEGDEGGVGQSRAGVHRQKKIEEHGARI